MALLAKTHRISELPVAFIYLQFLMLLILAHYFAAHGKTIGSHLGDRSALGLPKGTIRFLLLVGYGGMGAFLYLNRDDLKYAEVPQGALTVLLALLVGAFVVGHLFSAFIRGASGGETPAWYQDVQAWFALLAMILLVLVVLGRIMNWNLMDEQKIRTEYIESALAAAVGFYIGARS
jgi:hypothetical protein